ncbi:MAG: hypothetical protein ABJA70_18550 [Chryseolinea sp.]
MLTGSRISAGFRIVLLLMVSHSIFGQARDSVTHTPFEQYWTNYRLIPKLGGGSMDRAFIEAGVQYQSIYKHPLTLITHGPYSTVDVFINSNNLLLAPKVGYEFTAGLIGLAADVSYFIDHNYDHEGGNRGAVMITPKGGISILGFANLFYGYSIPVSKETISSITRNRFSLVFNINRDYFDLKEAPRRKYKKRG